MAVVLKTTVLVAPEVRILSFPFSNNDDIKILRDALMSTYEYMGL